MAHSISKLFKVWAVRGIMSSNGECSHLYNPPNPQVPIHFDSLTLQEGCVFADTRTGCVLSTLLEFHLKPQWALEINYCWHFSLESFFTWRVFCWDRIESPFVSSERRLRCLHHCVLEALLEKSALKYSSQKNNPLICTQSVCLSAQKYHIFVVGPARASGEPWLQERLGLLLSRHWGWDSQSWFLQGLTGALILLPFTAPHLGWFQDFISETSSVLWRHKAEQERGASVLSQYLRRLLIHWWRAFVLCYLFPADISASTRACVLLNMCTPVLLAAHFAPSLPSFSNIAVIFAKLFFCFLFLFLFYYLICKLPPAGVQDPR